jgi:hypothetical protein
MKTMNKFLSDPRFARLLDDVRGAGFGEPDDMKLAMKIWHGAVWPGLSRAEVRLNVDTNVAEIAPIEQPVDFLFCDSECKSR